MGLSNRLGGGGVNKPTSKCDFLGKFKWRLDLPVEELKVVAFWDDDEDDLQFLFVAFTMTLLLLRLGLNTFGPVINETINVNVKEIMIQAIIIMLCCNYYF